MDALVKFLWARVDEDEQVARATAPPPATSADLAWKAGDKFPADNGWCVYAPNKGIVDDLDEADAHHIARHDPARVLREVEAQRRIIDEHKPYALDAHDRHGAMVGCAVCEHADTPYPCRTLRLLTLPYAGHPDYLPEWRP